MKDLTKQRILKAAIKIASSQNFKAIPRDAVASLAKVANGAVNYHFGTVTGLKSEVMKHAVENEILTVIAEGLVDNHPVALTATAQLKEKAFKQYWV